MIRMTKRALPLLLTLILIIGITAWTGLTASAVNAATEAALIKYVAQGGDVRLTKDITLTDTLVIPEGVSVKLNLNGKTLDRGLGEATENGSVISVSADAHLTISDSSDTNAGTVTGGASPNGGGIYNAGTLVLEGGTVKGNKASGDTEGNGGGIYNEGSLTLCGGVIKSNTARNGAGVFNAPDAVLTVEQKVTTEKVGVQAVDTITNASITGNTAENLGSGIYNDSEMSLCDAPYICKNGGHDIYNPRGSKICVAGELTFTNKIVLKTSGVNTAVTENYSLYNTKKPTAFFAASDTSSVIRLTSAENGEVMLVNETKGTLLEVYESKKLVRRETYDDPVAAWTKAQSYAKDNEYIRGFTTDESVVEITLGEDWVCDRLLNTGSKKNMVIDLNGFCIRRDGKKRKDGNLFKVGEYARLTVYDSNPESDGYKDHKGGVIADGSGSSCGGGVIVEKYGQFYMNGGTIYNCVTDEHGGAVYAAKDFATVHMKDCAIDSCVTKDSGDDCHGGGIYIRNAGSVILDNVAVRNCKSEDKGGGLYLCGTPRSVALKNVCFESNYANDGGGAIFIDDIDGGTEFKFVAEDCTFTKNSAGDKGGAVYVDDDDESKYRNPTVFLNCLFTENENKDNGSAIEVNDNGVVLNGCTITGNTTTAKGAVYVEDQYDISVSGKCVIRDNKGKSGTQDLVLEKDDKTAYVYCAGLYKGSYISVSSSNGKTGITGVKDVSEYQARYFHAESGNLVFNKTGTKEAALVTASLFGKGAAIPVLILGGAAVLIAGGALIVIKKRKGVSDDDNDENEDE